MSSRKVCAPVLVIALSLGALPELQALPLQGARGENRIQETLANRIFQDLLEFWHELMEQSGPSVGNDVPEGPGLCPNGKPPGRQGVNGSGGGNGNGNGNGNG